MKNGNGRLDIVVALEIISLSHSVNKLVSLVLVDVRYCAKEVNKRYRPLIEMIAMSKQPHLVARDALKELRTYG